MIVAVAGGKGGVGKSTVALNLGRELDAVVVDADLATADCPRGRGPDLHDVLAGRADPVAAVDRIGSVRLLSSGRTLAGARAADLSALTATIERVEREWGRVVVDCPAGLARDAGVALQSADVAVLVTTPAESALVDGLRTREVALELETPIAAVVLNRATLPGDASLPDRIEREVGAPTAVLQERPIVAESTDRWRPVREIRADASAVETFETVARTIERHEERRPDRSRR